MAINAEIIRPSLRRRQEQILPNLWQDLTSLAIGFFARAKKMADGDAQPERATAEKTGVGASWQTLSYLKNQELYHNREQLITYMALELRTYFDEYVALKVIKTYPDFGVKGIANLSALNLVAIAQQTKESLLAAGFDTTRAQLEITAMQKISSFLEDDRIFPGSCLTYISPRGPKYMYLGYELTNNNYINLYLKTGHGKAMLVQLLNYDLNENLINEFLGFLADQQQAKIYNPFSNHNPFDDLTSATLNSEHFLINTMMFIPAAHLDLEKIISQSLKNSATWKTKISDFPKFDHQAYLKQEANLLNLFRQLVAEELASAGSDQLTASSDLFTAQKIDQLVIIMKKNFQKWTEENATNYQSTIKNSELNLADIELEWQLACKKLTGQQLDQQEKQQAQQLKQRYQLNPSLPLQNLSQLKFCLPRINLPQNITLSAGKGLTNLQGLDLVKFTQKQNYVTLKLAGKSWKVPANYLKGKCCYENGGVAYGPCGIPLNHDPYAITLKDYQKLTNQNLAKNEKFSPNKSAIAATDFHPKSENLVGINTFINSLVFGDPIVEIAEEF